MKKVLLIFCLIIIVVGLLGCNVDISKSIVGKWERINQWNYPEWYIFYSDGTYEFDYENCGSTSFLGTTNGRDYLYYNWDYLESEGLLKLYDDGTNKSLYKIQINGNTMNAWLPDNPSFVVVWTKAE